MTLSLRDMPIKRKLTLVIVLTTSFALLLMGSGIIAYELITFRRSLAANMDVLARIIGSNSTAALAFEDRENAQEILSALSAEKQVSAVAIYDRQGRLFAKFPDLLASLKYPREPKQDGYTFEKGHLMMFQPIMQDGNRLGTIFLRADLDAMYSRINVYGALLLLVGASSFLGALILASTLQRRVSSPILELAKVAQAVSERQDYSVRGTKHGGDEIGKLTDAFNQMLVRIGETTDDLGAAKEAAESANKAKDNFLATLSHELRTPLTPVLATLDMLRDDKRTPSYILEELDVISRNIEVEARLIDDLLDVTRIIRGKLDLQRQAIDVRTLLEHAMQNFCVSVAAEKNLHLSMDGAATETYVPADRSRLTQVLWNLLQNACKFTPIGGTITVHVFNEDSAENGRPDLVVEICDNGVGISPEMIPMIFQPFEQGERSRSRLFGGLGLGLAISRAIVEAHGGSITAASRGKNQGTTVTVRLPTVSAPRAADQEKPSSGEAQTPSARPLRVLLVEDHPDTAQQLTRLLRRAGHEVICVGGVKEALGQGRNGHFDVLISDLGLPDGNGYDLMRNLMQAHPIPGIALSGVWDERRRSKQYRSRIRLPFH
jgi:signal transduction histidine kinase